MGWFTNLLALLGEQLAVKTGPRALLRPCPTRLGCYPWGKLLPVGKNVNLFPEPNEPSRGDEEKGTTWTSRTSKVFKTFEVYLYKINE